MRKTKIIKPKKIKEFLIGTAIGDAFGLGLEFEDREWIRKKVLEKTKEKIKFIYLHR